MAFNSSLIDADRAPGSYEVRFDGTGTGGIRLGAGVYFYRLQIDGNSWTRKLVLIP